MSATKTRWISLLFTPLLLLSPLISFAADDSEARKIMDLVDAVDDGDRAKSRLQMTLIDKRGNQRVRELQRFSMDQGEDIHSMLFFLSPADVKNTGFLTYDYDDAAKDDDQWLYLPALRKTKRIASSDKSGSFMGSDFSYSDMTRRVLDDYDFSIVKEDEVNGHKVWLIQATPRNKAIIKETGYKKSILFVRQDIHIVIRAVHWLDSGGKLKYFEVTSLDKIDGIWTALTTEMTTKKGKKTLHKTELKLNNVSYQNQDIESSMFSVRTLEKGL